MMAPVPIYIADYVLMTYGTGAIMAVPAHDERDFDFARKYGIEIRTVIAPAGEPVPETPGEVYTGEGVMVNSDRFDGLTANEGKKAVAAELEQRGIGGPAITYRIRDWLVSRQRMWGTPIPILYCEKCGTVPVPEKHLPVVLPDVVEFKPTGESPLKLDPEFRYTACPECGGAAERETDTMDTFVDSSWYQYRYLGSHNYEEPFDASEGAYWLPVDLYTGGAEHAVMHLLYARFFHKVMRDMGLLDGPRAAHPERNWDEPFPRLFSQGVITSFAYRTPTGSFVSYNDADLSGETPRHKTSGEPLTESVEKMSKSKLNVVAPDDYVSRYGADVVRLFLMFIGPWEQGGPWNPRGVEGVVRFLNRVWSIVTEPAAAEGSATPEQIRELSRAVHQTVRKLTGDMERFSYNTVVSALMELSNTLQRLRQTRVAGTPEWRDALEKLVLLMAPIAPHVSEEMWERLGRPYSVHQQPWPQWSEELAAEDSIEIVVQVNGKVRDKVTVPAGASEEVVRAAVMASPRIQAELAGNQVRKFVYVPGRLVNLVISPNGAKPPSG
jgi:leucyl-tRNA synthetase